MLDLKSIMIGVLFGIALVFILGASHKKGKKGTRPVGMYQLYAIPNSDSKAVILHTASGEYKIANLVIGSRDLHRNEKNFYRILSLQVHFFT